MTTYVALDREWNADLECYETAFAVEELGPTWNGWAVPIFSRGVASAFIARQEMLAACHGGEPCDEEHLAWDGNGIIVNRYEAGRLMDLTWIMPTDSGLFDFGDLGWTFTVVGEDDRVVRRIG